MNEGENRRPLASRNTGWAAALTRWLARTSVSPNQISMASMAAALVAGAAFWLAGNAADPVARAALLIVAAGCCQLRLLCNLLDGMVAIEAGKGAPDGAFWNEFPDRVSDLLILAGLGYGIGHPALGWAAAALAILTAYVRELGRGCGLAADFSGPMAKPQRMALVTAAALLSVFEPLWSGKNEVLWAALWLVAIGSGVTVVRRSWRIVTALRARG
jgi:phosphatidylglycerophosphate synthase